MRPIKIEIDPLVLISSLVMSAAALISSKVLHMPIWATALIAVVTWFVFLVAWAMVQAKVESAKLSAQTRAAARERERAGR